MRETVSVGALTDAGLYAVLADAAAGTARLARGNAARLLAGHTPQAAAGDRFDEALAAVDTACAYLDELLEAVAESVPWSTAQATAGHSGASAAS